MTDLSIKFVVDDIGDRVVRTSSQSHVASAKKTGHKSLDCKDLKNVVCYGCGDKGHIKTNYPKRAVEGTAKPREAKKSNARAFQLNAREAIKIQMPIRAWFLLEFYLILEPIRDLLTINGSIETASMILDGCVISITNHSIPVNLLPMTLAGFDMVLGMDWLADNQARIACDKKLIEINSPTLRIAQESIYA
ncbi:uncharacterized protein LOC110883437 [Helianthus annuus]|uniref:uncharacterized protein LOC110883437 n=1 Tax=Helianthus annuus TaxID=4232 RepID=UPI000B8F4B19|nr:uncharacterized protein LOC110883437 [Helianthus annuus]